MSIDISLLKVPDVRAICEPLVEYFDISTFSYLKINSDLSRVHLDYHEEWSQYFYQNISKFCPDDNLTESHQWEPGFSSLYVLDDPCIPDSALFGIGDGVVISNIIDNCNELCFFCGNHVAGDDQVTNMLNNIDLLHMFIRNFRDKASDLIKDAEKTPIVLPGATTASTSKAFRMSNENKLGFINSVNKGRYPALTTKEYQCLKMLEMGLSSKEIAKNMGLSAKTVDRHFENLRSKFGFARRSELLNIIR